MSDVFAPPNEPNIQNDEPTGEINALLALSQALSNIGRNIGPLFGALGVAFVAYIMSCCTLVGWLYVLPVLTWGAVYWSLKATRGDASISDLWAPILEDPVTPWLYTVGQGIVMLFINSPALLVGFTLAYFLQGADPLHAAGYTLVSQTAGLLYGLIVSRLSFAMLRMVDTDLGPLEAITAVWQDCRQAWGQLALIILSLNLLITPIMVATQAGNAWMQERMIGVSDPLLLLQDLPVLYVGLITMSLVQYGVFIVYGMTIAAAYEQLYNAPTED